MAPKFFKRKFAFFIAFAGVLFCCGLTYSLVEDIVEPRVAREPASRPDNYESLSACEKQNILWEKAKASVYVERPAFREFGVFQLLALGKQTISTKGSLESDFAPAGWKKYLHARAVLAEVKLVAKSSKYSGAFQGADCALLRLSLTFKPTQRRGVAPGLALKILRDGVPSANVSALVSLEGQNREFNFFRYPMSNVVPMGSGIGAKLVHHIFGKVSGFPEELLATEFARLDTAGKAAPQVVSPRQIFFVPGDGLKFSSEEHDVRDDLLKIPAGTTVYHVYAVPEKYADFDYGKYTGETVSQFLHEAELIADIVTTSEFLASEFGDEGIFFRHQLRYK